MKTFTIYTILIFHVGLAIAQAPQQFSFQGVARKADGKVVVNALISARLTIHSETAAGTAVYQETHTAQTNAMPDLVAKWKSWRWYQCACTGVSARCRWKGQDQAQWFNFRHPFK